MWVNYSVFALILLFFLPEIVRVDDVMGLNMRILEVAKIVFSSVFFSFIWGLKKSLTIVYLERLFFYRIRKPLIVTRSHQSTMRITFLVRKSLLDFPWSWQKNSHFNDFYLSSIFSVLYLWYVFWILVLTGCRFSQMRIKGYQEEIYLLFACALHFFPEALHIARVFSSPLWFIFISSEHWNCFSNWGWKNREVKTNKQTIMRQQICKTKAYSQDLSELLHDFLLL